MPTLQRNLAKTEQLALSSRTYSAGVFSTAFFAALVFFAGINLILSNTPTKKHQLSEVAAQAAEEKQSGKVSSHSWAWWLTKLYGEETKAPDVVVFGSSLLGSAHISADANYEDKLLDVLMHRRMSFLADQLSKRVGHKIDVYSLGTPGQMMSDAFAITKALFSESKKPKVVIATIAPRDFIDSTLPCPAATEHYKFFSKFLNLNEHKASAYPDFFARFGAEIDGLPLKQQSAFALNRFAESTKAEFAASEISRVEPGTSMVPAKAVPARVDNTAEYKERFRNRSEACYKGEMQFFNAWLSDMKKQGIEVIVVAMPTSEQNRKLLPEKFWTTFRQDVASTCRANNADWFDLSDSGLFQASDYLDTVHLNAYGGVRLFPVLAEKLAMQSRFTEALRK